MRIMFEKSKTDGWIVLGGKKKKVLGWIKKDPDLKQRYVWKQDVDVGLNYKILVKILNFMTNSKMEW